MNEFDYVKDSSDWLDYFASLDKAGESEDASSKKPPIPEVEVSSLGSSSSVSSKGGVGVYVHHYVNTRSNDCGQAAIASLAAYWQLPVATNLQQSVFDSRDGRNYPSNSDLVNAVWNDFPADAGIEWWTWKEQIVKALSYYGLKNVGYGHSAAWSDGKKQWNDAVKRLSMRQPIIVLLNLQPISNQPFNLHWVVLFGFDGQNVHLTNMGQNWSLPWYLFMKLWHCEGYIYPNNFVYITGNR